MNGIVMPDSILRLLETWRLRWVLLQLAAEFDKQWFPALHPHCSGAAVEEVFCVARKLGGVGRDFGSLGELRRHLLDHIIRSGATLAGMVSALTPRSRRFESRRRCVEDLLFISLALDRSVGMLGGELTDDPGAQRALLSSLESSLDHSPAARRGPELVRLTCSHVLGRLDDWFVAERHQTWAPDCVSTRASDSPSLFFHRRTA